MKKFLKNISEMNNAIVEGSARVGWLVPIFTSSSIISYALSTININLAYASLAVPVLTVGCYYFLGKAHLSQKEEPKLA